jgi:hypothetical protein
MSRYTDDWRLSLTSFVLLSFCKSMKDILSNTLITRRVFFPRITDVAPTDLIDVGQVKIACYRSNPDPAAGTLLHFHGNGELAADYWQEWIALFAFSGLNLCFVDYRGYGFSEGAPDLITQLGDSEALVDALGVSPERLIVLGRSLGSVFAVDLVYRRPEIAGLVLESAIANVLEDWVLEEEVERLGANLVDLRREANLYFDQHEKISAYKGGVLILHAECDRHVSISNAERLYAWSNAQQKRMIRFAAGDHNTIIPYNMTDYAEALRDFALRIGVVKS